MSPVVQLLRAGYRLDGTPVAPETAESALAQASSAASNDTAHYDHDLEDFVMSLWESEDPAQITLLEAVRENFPEALTYKTAVRFPANVLDLFFFSLCCIDRRMQMYRAVFLSWLAD